MENLEIDNKLTGKLCLSTYRLFYVEETEDYYYRRGQMRHSRRNGNSSKRCEKLHSLMDSRTPSPSFFFNPSTESVESSSAAPSSEQSSAMTDS